MQAQSPLPPRPTSPISTAEAVLRLLQQTDSTLAVAESCTGGHVCAALTAVSGASKHFLGGAVAYTDGAKQALLGVDTALLDKEGAVSHAVAEAMAIGVANTLGTACGLSLTGFAGPSGGSPACPIGSCFAGFYIAGTPSVEHLLLKATRVDFQLQATHWALRHLLDRLSDTPTQSP